MQATLIGFAAAAIAFWLRTLPVVSDPYNYVLAGRTFPELTWNMVGLTRYGIILPLIPITALFHDSEMAFYLTPLIATGVLMGSIHWLASRFFGALSGVAAVLASLACSPILVNTTRLYPDIFAAASTTLAVAVAMATRDASRGASRTRLWLLLVATGLAVGASWWMRETTVFSWPIVAAVLLWRGGPGWRLTGMLAGGAAILTFLAEMLVSRIAFGDWMARIHALSGVGLAGTTNPNDIPYLNQSRLAYLLTVPDVTLRQPDGVVLALECLLALLGALLLRRAVAFFAGWFVCSALVLILLGGALSPAAPSIRLDLTRYWLPFLVPMIIAAVGTVSSVVAVASPTLRERWGERRGPRLAAAAVVACLAVVPAIPTGNWVRHNPEFVVTNGGVMNEFRGWVTAHPEVRVMWTDMATQRQLPTYTRTFSGRPLASVEFRQFEAEPPPAGSYVVVFSRDRRTCYFCRAAIAGFFAAHPDARRGWTSVWQSHDKNIKVFQVNANAPNDGL